MILLDARGAVGSTLPSMLGDMDDGIKMVEPVRKKICRSSM